MASSLFTALLGAIGISSFSNAGLELVKDFGDNPTGIEMNVYAPANLKPSPAIILQLHGCGGNKQQGFSMTGFSKYAEKRNFVIIAPTTSKDSHCWDNHSEKSLKHDGGGDSQSLANMVKYAIKKYNADPKKVFVTGFSSGGMMTNTMAAVYPDVFAAAVAQSGVPAGCMAGRGTSAPSIFNFGSTANEDCAQGKLTKSPAQYLQIVKNMYPGYTGPYPKYQAWHGDKDNLVYPASFRDELTEWSSVHGVPFAKNVTGDPKGYTHVVYGDGSKVEGYLYGGGGHSPNYSGNEEIIFKFFGI